MSLGGSFLWIITMHSFSRSRCWYCVNWLKVHSSNFHNWIYVYMVMFMYVCLCSIFEVVESMNINMNWWNWMDKWFNSMSLTCQNDVITCDNFLGVWGCLRLNWRSLEVMQCKNRVSGVVGLEDLTLRARLERLALWTSPSELLCSPDEDDNTKLFFVAWIVINWVSGLKLRCSSKSWKSNAQSYNMTVPYEINCYVWMICEYILWNVCIIVWLIVHAWWWIIIEII